MSLTSNTDEYYMHEALKEAKKAFDADEVPIGAVIVSNEKIIARAHNLTERLNDVTAHAEMQAFTSAANFLGGKYLDECTLYVTVEPCLMCAGASYWTRIGKIIFGARDEKKGFLSLLAQTDRPTKKISVANSPAVKILHPLTKMEGGLLEEECATLMKEFFRKKR